MKKSKNNKTRYTAGAARRRKSRSKNRAGVLLVLCVVALLAGVFLPANCGDTGNEPVRIDRDGNLEYVVTNSSLPEELIHYTGMTVSFNPELHIPNWVAYELTAEEADGTEPRSNKFMADENVKGSATPADYRNTGFDRGHMAPAADMKWSPEAMKESFYMTNMAPQVHSLNSGSWAKLEDKCRQRARRDSAVIIISGPVLTDEIEMYIGDSRVAVPSRFFKVVLSPYTNPPMAIGFIMPNGKVEGGMQQCAVTVDSVEAVTGHDFFSALPDEIENRIESQVNFNKWSRAK